MDRKFSAPLSLLCGALFSSMLLASPVSAGPTPVSPAAPAAAFSAAPASGSAGNAKDGAISHAEAVDAMLSELPCPSFWKVQPNPSVENSLSYVHDSGEIAVSVTYIAGQSGADVSAETFSWVAAEQMNCTLPVRSNLLAHAWYFNCQNDGVEAVVYGEPGNLVLLSIVGRNEETESYLDSFISFLSYQADNR